MKRVAARLLLALGWGLGLAGTATSCASSDGVSTTGQYIDGSADAMILGSCDSRFCPGIGTGVGCCLTANGPCGVDYGPGCTAAPTAADGG